MSSTDSSSGEILIKAQSIYDINARQNLILKVNQNKPPVSVIASQGDYLDRIEINWNSLPGATRYMVYRGTDDYVENSTALTEWIEGVSYVDTSAMYDNHYRYFIKAASDSFGLYAGEASEPALGYLKQLDAPENVYATKGESTSITVINWGKSMLPIHTKFSETRLPDIMVLQKSGRFRILSSFQQIPV